MIGNLPVKLVIFDCDGVLVDSERLANQVLAKALQSLGLDYSLQRTIDQFMGRSLKSCFAQIEQELKAPLPPGFATQLDQDTFAAFERSLEPVEGVVELLDWLQPQVATCVASSGSHQKMAMTLGKTGLLQRFSDRIFSAYQVPQGKPAPDLFLFASERMGIDPKHCIVIEDSPFGVMAARAANMRVLAYCAITPRQRLEEHGAQCFERMNQVPALLAEFIQPSA